MSCRGNNSDRTIRFGTLVIIRRTRTNKKTRLVSFATRTNESYVMLCSGWDLCVVGCCHGERKRWPRKETLAHGLSTSSWATRCGVSNHAMYCRGRIWDTWSTNGRVFCPRTNLVIIYVDDNSCLWVPYLRYYTRHLIIKTSTYINVKEWLHSANAVTTPRRNSRPPMRQCL
jgi:hypothetical protein